MHSITRKHLNEFAAEHSDMKTETLFVPHTEERYNQLVQFLDKLIDEVGEDDNHPLASLMEIIGVLIEQYENNYFPEL